ncbi:TetR/AcrR family transcriptional regulator [Pseudonocardia xinjiangensis]|uniref:TetR/AcrR family transcriptional regulator n=1 Tax=Pseudonocardia xinjiangensis TaxID=75289 RepID=UPI003D8FC443
MRADARRNRERVLVAAREAFESEGVTVPLDEIARRAGVGAGTVHRHFPTKEALFEAIVVGNMIELTDQARARLEDADAGAAFFGFFTLMVERGAGNRALTAALTQAGADVASIAERPSRDLLTALDALLARAQRAGAVRSDMAARHVKALLIGVYAGSDWLGGGARDRRRLLAVVCEGLRTQPD